MTTPFLADVGISDWEGIAPSQLIEDPELASSKDTINAAARAMKYARADGTTLYDDIAFRHSAACPAGTDVPLRTISHMHRERAQVEGGSLHRELRQHLDQFDALRHRALEIPSGSHMRYRVVGNMLEYRPVATARSATTPAQVWTFSLSSPPVSHLQQGVEDRDAALLLSQKISVEVPGMFWLPLPAVIASETFQTMQRHAGVLQQSTAPGNFYAFVSHRWLTRTHPDPDGVQARLLCWQLFASLCEAVWVAGRRGLYVPRKHSRLLGFAIGPGGSDLAESMLVNLVRPAVEASKLDLLQREIASIEGLWLDRGVAVAFEAAAMQTLSEVLCARPLLSTLMQRIFIWYDYSCMPQAPRTAEEQALFQAGLQHLNGIQCLGRTIVLLDDVEDYMSRAWCTVESMMADTQLLSIDLLVGSSRATVERGNVEQYFRMLMEDRPHFIWRGLLDTEVFRVQTPVQCMARLGLTATDGADLPLLYERLRRLHAPGKIHVDGSEVVTGLFPLPLLSTDTVAVWDGDTVPFGLGDLGAYPSLTLDWTGALDLRQCWPAEVQRDAAAVTSYATFVPAPAAANSDQTRPRAHVAVIGSCEGEAVLLSSWVERRRDELESALQVQVVSRSWFASDIAPVGQFICGDLSAKGIGAEVWVLVALATRFQYCRTTSLLLTVLNHARRTTIGVLCDRSQDNMLVLLPTPNRAPDEGRFIPPAPLRIPTLGFPVHRGGLFQMMLQERLVRAEGRS